MLTAQDLAAFRGERLVLRGVSFAVAAGGALLLLGPNGSGKSTLLRLLAGLKRPDAGQLLWHGEDALADLSAHARRVAYLGHQDAIKPGLSVAENLLFAAAGRPVAAALEALGLAALADLPARMLSAGQKRRAGAGATGAQPGAALAAGRADAGAGPGLARRLGALLATHRAAGGMVVAATHLDLPLPGAAEQRLG
ncbi:MAG: heme ABC exporter ATP-binding protein CcmA [Acetobacteraceae bacterium]